MPRLKPLSHSKIRRNKAGIPYVRLVAYESTRKKGGAFGNLVIPKYGMEKLPKTATVAVIGFFEPTSSIVLKPKINAVLKLPESSRKRSLFKSANPILKRDTVNKMIFG